MKLYLSSYLLGEDPSFLRREDHDGKALVVFNALDGYPDTRMRWEDDWKQRLAEIGYSYEELDLREHFADEPPAAGPLHERLANADLVWVLGGNAYVLARAMHQSRFSLALAQPLREGRIIYGGFSAGACVAGPDLQGIDLMDEPDLLPEGYTRAMEPRCLGLVPFRIVPHFESDHPEAADAKRAAAWLKERGLDHRTLRDGEVIAFG